MQKTPCAALPRVAAPSRLAAVDLSQRLLLLFDGSLWLAEPADRGTLSGWRSGQRVRAAGAGRRPCRLDNLDDGTAVMARRAC